MTDRIGQQIGNYRLTRLLGQGGFAEVYLGEHLFLGTTIAIKVLRAHIAPEDMAQFQQEARILADLKHPHIVNILDFGIEKRIPYLMMSYAPHDTLRTRHPKGTVLPITTVVEYVQQVTQALQYAHEHKIIHRDIKPENMLIGEQNEILLSDFGIALITQSSRNQNTTNMVGTIAYMAPEQIAGHPHIASDQYALGIVAYEWLCGTRPFHGSFTEIAAQHGITPPTPLLEHLSTLSPDIEDIILTALAKQPEKRFASVSAFATALKQASQDVPPIKSVRSEGTLPPVHTLDAITPSPLTTTILPSLLNQPAKPSTMMRMGLNPSVPISMPTIQTQPFQPNPPISETTIHKPTVPHHAVLIETVGKEDRGKLIKKLVAYTAILSLLILIISFIVPSFSSPSSSGTSLPPRLRPTPTSTTALPVSHITDLGSLNFQDYCRSIGHIRASLDQINAYGWACVTVSGDHVGIDTDAACQQQYKQPNVLSRMANYSDPKDWHCYSHVKGLGSINFPQYCQSLGQGASLDGKTAYDWHCVTSGSHVFIDTDAACRWQYNESDAFSSIRNYFSPNGWMCLGKA